ncbi:MAG: hypothetical protein H0U07_09195 [Actinobacteria bacterium]|jgi:hypothetical protein|nr:hypothetical protein [Actinomycetota bacterium]
MAKSRISDDVVAYVVGSEPASELQRVVASLEALIDGPLSDDDLHRFLYEEIGIARTGPTAMESAARSG